MQWDNMTIQQIMEENQTLGNGIEKKTYISNYSGYDYEGSENYEHDDNASVINYSGCEDDVFNAFAQHEDWQEGYDY